MQIFKQFKLLLIAVLVSVMAFSVVSSMPAASAAAQLFPGELTQYENQTLTPISTYIGYLKTHPDVAIKGTQYIDQSTYQLTISGLVNNPANYSYEEIVNINSALEVATLPCVEGWSVTLLWEGVLLTDLLEYSGGIGTDANTVIFYASDGYSSSLPLDYIKENSIMIAYKMNNVTLTAETGWPFFLVAKDQYGYKWVEWITEINVSNNSDYLGFWESRGYPNNAAVSGGQGAGQLDYSVGVLVLGVFIVFAVVVDVLVYRKDQQKARTKVYK
jgi:DMSO/TMAO reductase YedYZ molybdopterin-dependent catalytic subunit